MREDPFSAHDMDMKKDTVKDILKDTAAGRKTAGQFMRFICVGFINTAVTYAVFTVLVEFLDTEYTWANLWGYIAGVINSFIWNKTWVFRKKNSGIFREAALFILIFAICYGIQYVCLRLLAEGAGLNEYIAQLAAMCVYTVLNFILNRTFTFRTAHTENEHQERS